MKRKFRVFTNDIGPDRYSALCDVTARSSRDALAQVQPIPGAKIVAISHGSKEFWPDAKTGKLPPRR